MVYRDWKISLKHLSYLQVKTIKTIDMSKNNKRVITESTGN